MRPDDIFGLDGPESTQSLVVRDRASGNTTWVHWVETVSTLQPSGKVRCDELRTCTAGKGRAVPNSPDNGRELVVCHSAGIFQVCSDVPLARGAVAKLEGCGNEPRLTSREPFSASVDWFSGRNPLRNK